MASSIGALKGIWMMVRRSLRHHAVSTSITVLSTALACGLVLSVYMLSVQSKRAFIGGSAGFDAVVGAKGSQLQLVMNAVFHMDVSPGNIPYTRYLELKARPDVDLAIPYAVGDNLKGYRIVGTTEEIFTDFEYRKGEPFKFEAGGRPFNPENKEAVIGSVVAKALGLEINSKFQPYHGLVEMKNQQPHKDVYNVVGILEPTNTPSDKVIWIPIEGIYRMEGHYLRGTGEKLEAQAGEEIPDDWKEVSAVMLKLKGGFNTAKRLDEVINKRSTWGSVAAPIETQIAVLFNKIGWMNDVLRAVAKLVVVVAASSILASLYNTMNERRREFAILRSLGARRSTVFSAILLESGAIATLGALLGFGAYIIIQQVASHYIRITTGVVIDPFAWDPVLWKAPLSIIGLGVLSGVLPAIKAYSTDVAQNLLPTS